MSYDAGVDSYESMIKGGKNPLTSIKTILELVPTACEFKKFVVYFYP